MTIGFGNGKESKAQRRLRIAETENGRMFRQRTIADKRKKAPRFKKNPLDE